MADDVLSAAERETLLGRREAPPPAEGAHSAANKPVILPFAKSAGPQLDEAAAGRLASIHTQFARDASAELSAQLRRSARVRFTRWRETNQRSLVDDLGRPACVSVLAEPSLPGKWLLAIEPGLLYPMIDNLLGGGRHESPPVRRSLTEIEQRLAGRLVGRMTKALETAWQGHHRLALSLETIVCDPRQLPPPSAEAIVCLSFEITVGTTQGKMVLAMPLVAVLDALHSQHAAAQSGGQAEPTTALVELTACLEDFEIADGELHQLSVGDVIQTEQPSAAPIRLLHDGKAMYQSRLGSLAGRKAVEIERESAPNCELDD